MVTTLTGTYWLITWCRAGRVTLIRDPNTNIVEKSCGMNCKLDHELIKLGDHQTVNTP